MIILPMMGLLSIPKALPVRVFNEGKSRAGENTMRPPDDRCAGGGVAILLGAD